jgi:hypothetical protein
VHVRGRHAATRIGAQLDHDPFAAGIGRRLDERHPLAGDGIDQGLSFLDHFEPPCSSLTH